MQRENIIIIILLAVILAGGVYVVANHMQQQVAPGQETESTPCPTVMPASTEKDAGVSGALTSENPDTVLAPPSSSDRLEIFVDSAEWDGDSGDDGIIVHFSFYDEQNRKKVFDGALLRTHVLVYTPDTNRQLSAVRPLKVLYNGYTTITGSSEGKAYPLRGIRVPYDDMSFASSDRGIGKVRIEVQVSQGTLIGEENYLYCR